MHSPSAAPNLPVRLIAVEQNGMRRRLTLDLRLALPLVVLVAGLGIWSAAATGYVLFRDELLTSLVGRQREVQYAYEDRLAALRSSIDRLTSRQLIDQDTFEGKVQDLVARQALLESRQAIVASIASQADALPRTTAAAPAPRMSAGPPVVPLSTATKNLGGPAPDGLSAFAPLDGKPRPAADPIPLRGSATGEPRLATPRDRTSALAPAPSPATAGLPPAVRIGAMDAAARRLEATQVEALAIFASRANAVHSRYLFVMGELGIDRTKLDRLDASRAQGGPFVPVDPGAGPFENAVHQLQVTLAETERLRRVADSLPLRRPLRGDVDTTSGFGYRVDPFTRSMALHTGIDFRDDYGSPVRATAPGKVIAAEWNGGYGNMVEVDHGNGLSTRYAHLSALSVSEGQKVEAGTVVGKLGSTGRSTGPHLHYETRVDGDPVDPARYLRAGARLVE
jgi:murein DD-endopeptidase MepM/ murein hydrolase activator NlpD